MKDLQNTKMTLFEAVRQQKKDLYGSMWRIESNFDITNHEDLKDYCDKNGLIKIDTDVSWGSIDFKIDKNKIFDKLKTMTFYENCVIKDGEYKSFGIHEKAAILYGYETSEINVVQLTFSENQEINDEKNYWGFFDYRDNCINNIQSIYNLMSISCGGGAKHSEIIGNGFAVKLEIKPIEDKLIKNWWNNISDMMKIDYVEEVLKLKSNEVNADEIRKNISFDEIKRIFNYYFVLQLKYI